MFKFKYFIISTLIIFVFLVGCSADKTPNDGDEWESYLNSKFGFTVKFPPKWSIGEESDNGDGINLYVGNPEVSVLAFASHYYEDFNPYESTEKDGFTRQRLILDNGKSADLILGKLDEKVFYELVLIENDVVYKVYAEVSESFFEKNEDKLLKVAKSLDIPGNS